MAKQANEQKKPDKKYDVWRMRWSFILCGLFALLLVPGSTIALAGRDNALYFSLSAIGNAPGNRLALILWTLASSGFFVYALRLLLLLCGQNNSLSEPLMCLAGGMLVVCNLLPFLPDELPRLAQYHNFLAMSASCLVALSLLVFVVDLRKFDIAVCKESAGLLTLVLVSGGLPFFLFGVNGVLEGICIILVCLFLFFVLILVVRANAAAGIYAQTERESTCRKEGQ
ncbi:MAG: hypothetical protein KHX17_00285 [Clostridiales bacterium]|jgi:membrane protein|nr:hypothetical protein [Clostridiales bacterium]